MPASPLAARPRLNTTSPSQPPRGVHLHSHSRSNSSLRQQQQHHHHQQQHRQPSSSAQRRQAHQIHRHRHVFTCTFCWRLRAGPPRVLGRSAAARLACAPCHAAILALAVCWVCGEVVVRGDECVSLGWCFWHRACYGCLLCGCRMVVRGPGVGEVFVDEDDEDDGDEEEGEEEEEEEEEGMGVGVGVGVGVLRECGTAREIDEVPLCANCLAEVDVDGDAAPADQPALVQKALRTVDRVDGGLARQRWEGLVGREPARFAEGNIHLHRSRDGRSLNSDGASAEPADLAMMEEDDDEASPSTIYVSVLDPIGSLAFRPSPTKPIPEWMQLAPPPTSNGNSPRDEDGDGGQRADAAAAAAAAAAGRPRWPRRRSNHSSCATICPDGRQHRMSPTAVSPTQSVSSSSTSMSHYGGGGGGGGGFDHRGTSFVSNEPLRLPSSLLVARVNADANLSSSTFDTYRTPPEYPSPPPSHGRGTPDSLSSDASDSGQAGHRTRTGAPSGYYSSVSHVRRQDKDSHGGGGQRHGALDQRVLQSTAQLHRAANTALSSSEYLERFQPLKRAGTAPSSASTGQPGRRDYRDGTLLRRGADVGGNNDNTNTNGSIHGTPLRGRGQIMARMRRNSRAEPSTGLVFEETATARMRADAKPAGVVEKGERRGVGIVKRRSVHAELKRLFGR
ncbi:hypothetical protein B0T24DRAFT_356262 [Lasiosphaeria ovina]|uniref:LIM zinc-binding domain-containing protein n=1 Tax=Lasiosphaeria ovina TaxID=92902 RepID=A0AAE0N360_9PEZI|nr:hypothetical protein B0T24DRAFT_356262 [Lasiosphaeria ovina]